MDKEHDDFVKTKNFFPFGVGRRRCAGQTLAYVELYTLLGRVLQTFRILPAGKRSNENFISKDYFKNSGNELPSLERSTGMTNEPKPFEVILERIE